MKIGSANKSWHEWTVHAWRLMVTISTYRHRPTHGPQSWPWWRLLVVNVVRCRDALQTPLPSWNVWAYTRWGAWCWYVAIRPAPWRRPTPAEIDRIRLGECEHGTPLRKLCDECGEATEGKR